MVLCCADIDATPFAQLLGRYGIVLEWVKDGEDIPGSFWGDSEAGIIANRLIVRRDTPLHSALHEGCHYICMDQERRSGLDTDAGGGYDEENGVNYLQLLLSNYVAECGMDRMFNDMDEWGYSYRLGSARAWFEQDAEDAKQWLLSHQLITDDNQPSWQIRQ